MVESLGDKSHYYAGLLIDQLKSERDRLIEENKRLIDEIGTILELQDPKQQEIDPKRLEPVPGNMTLAQKKRVAQELWNKSILEKIESYKNGSSKS